MEAELDLTTASRETLLTIIAEQGAVITELRQRVENLEARLSNGGGSGPRMPGHKPGAKRKGSPERKGLRKKRQHGFGRPRMEATRQQTHAPDSCPECHAPLSGGWVHRTREVIDLPVLAVEVTEHVFMARTCPVCRRRRLPQDPLREVVVGRQRLGINLVSLIVALREEGRLPVRTIQWYLETVHRMQLSAGAIVRVLHQVARQAAPVVEGIREQVRGSPVVHADETGWRENGKNGYVWTFSTATERYFLRRGRGKEVVDGVLGESFEGILTSDFYAAYHHYPGLKQRCWVHPRSGSGAGSAAGHPQPEGNLPQRCRAGSVGQGSEKALHQGQGFSRWTAAILRAVGAGETVAGVVPAFPRRPSGAPGETVPPD